MSTEHEQRANGANLKPVITTLMRTCQSCKVKSPKSILGTQGNRIFLKCVCGREWGTNVKRGEL